MDKKLESEHKDHVVVTFGRMNPPTVGHKKLIDHVKHLAKHHGADHRVFVSATHDAKKNPLTHKQKVHFVKEMMPGTHVHEESDVKTPLDAMKHLQKHGYKKVTFVVGQDRVKDFHNLLHKYNGNEYKFDHIHVVSAGHRDPDAEGVEGMSASKMRHHAASGNFKEFMKGVPSKKHAKELFAATRKGLKVEQYTSVFLLGAPGSGKDALLRESVLNDKSFVEIDLNRLQKAILEQKNVAEVDAGYPLIVNGNADDARKVLLVKTVLEAIGYKTGCVYVYTTNEISKQRNEQRLKLGAKTITEEVRSDKYKKSISNAKLFKDKFGTFFLYDNSNNTTGLLGQIDEQVEAWKEELNEGLKAYFVGQPSIDEVVEGFLNEQDFSAQLDADRNSAFKQFRGKKTSKSVNPPVTTASTSSGGTGLTNAMEAAFTTTNSGKPNKLTTALKAIRQPFTKGQIRPLSQDGGATAPLAAEGTIEKPEKDHRVAQNNGTSAKVTGKPAKSAAPMQTTTDARAGDDMAGVSTFEEADPEKDKPKPAKAPSTRGDSRVTPVDGATQVLGATTAESVSFSSFRKTLKTRSPDVEFVPTSEQYEDWGIQGEEAIFEGRAVKTNKPFKIARKKYRVYIKDDENVKCLEFVKKQPGTLEENLQPSDVRFWETK